MGTYVGLDFVVDFDLISDYQNFNDSFKQVSFAQNLNATVVVTVINELISTVKAKHLLKDLLPLNQIIMSTIEYLLTLFFLSHHSLLQISMQLN